MIGVGKLVDPMVPVACMTVRHVSKCLYHGEMWNFGVRCFASPILVLFSMMKRKLSPCAEASTAQGATKRYLQSCFCPVEKYFNDNVVEDLRRVAAVRRHRGVPAKMHILTFVLNRSLEARLNSRMMEILLMRRLLETRCRSQVVNSTT